jgi:regulatory protein
VTRAYLMNAGQAYLQRFGGTRASLRRILDRKAKQRGQETFYTAQTVDLIDEVLDALERIGLINDAAFAAGRAASLQRKGASSRLVLHKLGAKGVKAAVADLALEALELDDVKQALTAARRLKLGPWRRIEPGTDFTDAEIAKLYRRGFQLAAIRAAQSRLRDTRNDSG